jgi:hypothetical protein
MPIVARILVNQQMEWRTLLSEIANDRKARNQSRAERVRRNHVADDTNHQGHSTRHDVFLPLKRGERSFGHIAAWHETRNRFCASRTARRVSGGGEENSLWNEKLLR